MLMLTCGFGALQCFLLNPKVHCWVVCSKRLCRNIYNGTQTLKLNNNGNTKGSSTSECFNQWIFVFWEVVIPKIAVGLYSKMVFGSTVVVMSYILISLLLGSRFFTLGKRGPSFRKVIFIHL